MSLKIPEEFWEFKRNLYNFFAESGRRAHVLWRLEGSYGGLQEVSKEIVNPPGGGGEGIWVEPLKLMDYLHFYLWTEESGLISLESYPKDYIKRVGYSEILYQFSPIKYLDIVKRIWVPLDLEAVVIEIELINKIDEDKELKLVAQGKSRLTLGWPRRESGSDSCQYDETQRSVIIHSTARPEWTAIWGSDLEPIAYHLGDFQPYMVGEGKLEEKGTTDPAQGISCLQYNFPLPANGHQKLSFFVAGSGEGEEKARKVYSHALTHKDDLFKEKVDHYTRIFEDTTQIETPDFAFDKTFLWAKIAQEDFKHYDPNIGLCYFAGYPAYNFYFAGDSMRVIRGTTCLGDFEDIKGILRMITSYQATTRTRDQLPGEIWHEMSTTGDTISPNFVTLSMVSLDSRRYLPFSSEDRKKGQFICPKKSAARLRFFL